MIVRTSFVVAIALLVLPGISRAAAQEHAPSARPKAGAGTGRIEGRVLKLADASHLPELRVRRIELYLADSPRKSAQVEVDEDGTFIFEGVPSGRVRINPVLRVGDDQGDVKVSSALFLPTIIRAGETTRLTLFGKGRPVAGRVVLPGHIKPEHGRVRLQLLAPPFRTMTDRNGRITPGWRAYSVLTARPLEAELDGEGRFRIEGVREGHYRITAVAPVEGEPVGLSFDGVAEPGYPHVEWGKLTIPLAADGGSDKPYDLGALSFKLPPKDR